MDQALNEEKQQYINSILERHVSAFLKESAKEEIKQASDSWLALQPKTKWIDEDLLLQYQEYPTTQQYIKAFDCYVKGAEILENYGKESVDSVDDCRFLQPAFHYFVDGYLYENSLFPRDKIKNLSAVITQYLRFESEDFIAEFLHFIVVFKELSFEDARSQMSDYERSKKVIRMGEKLAQRLKSCKSKTPVFRTLRRETHYLLGSKYSLTSQPERALDAFEQSYKIDRGNPDVLYGIAYQIMNIDPERAIKHFNEYLQTVSKCSKKYPNALYMLAILYLRKKDMDEAFRLHERAEQANRERLPFLQPIEIQEKQTMDFLKSLKNVIFKETKIKI